MKTGIRVFEAMTHEPTFVKPDATVSEIAHAMKDQDVGGVLIVDENKVLGICTEKDLVYRVLANDMDVNKTLAKDIMSKVVKSLDANLDIFEAIMKMRDLNVRRMPVTNNGEFVGILTIKDILKIEPQLFDLLADQIELKEEHRKPIRESTPDEEVDDIISKD